MVRIISLFLTLLFLNLYAHPVNAQGITPCAAKSLSPSSGGSTNVQLSTCGGVVLLWNTGSQEAFYNYGSTSSATATTSNFSLPGTAFVVLNLGTQGAWLAAITASSSTTLRITQGQALR